MKKKASPRPFMILELDADRAGFNALGEIAKRLSSKVRPARECDAAQWLLTVALAKFDVLEPHINAVVRYCESEGVPQADAWRDLIARRFPVGKRKAKR